MRQKKGVIVFSGFNQRAVLAFVRTLESLKAQYAIIAKSPDDTILLSRYKSAVAAVRSTPKLLLDDILRCIRLVKAKMTWDDYVIAPSTEGLNRFLLKNRPLFEQESMIVPLVKESLYEEISDKQSFSLLCLGGGIYLPNEYAATPSKLKLPFVAKPKKYLNAQNEALSPVLIFTEKERQLFLKERKKSDFYYQEYIEGKSFYLLYYFDRAGNVFKFSQENIAQQPDGKSIVAATSARIHESELSSIYESLFARLGFRGFVMVEVRKRGREYFMIEANPRFWGPSQLFVDAKMNLFETFLLDYDVIGTPPNFSAEKAQDARYFWYGGIAQMYKEEKSLMHHVSDIITQKSLPSWFLQDVYMREDSLEVFKSELR